MDQFICDLCSTILTQISKINISAEQTDVTTEINESASNLKSSMKKLKDGVALLNQLINNQDSVISEHVIQFAIANTYNTINLIQNEAILNNPVTDFPVQSKQTTFKKQRR